MTPVELVLSKLPGAKPVGNAWQARCPAHEDRKPSLTVSEGDGGRALVRCHAGCSFEAVVAAIGLIASDLMPARDTPTPRRNGKPKPNTPTYSTANEAVAKLERQHGKRSALWTYHDTHGEPVGLVVRWDRLTEKDIRPISRYADGWRIGAMPDPRPLYGLPELATANRVVVVEGEKAADAARSIGFTATTSVGGSSVASKADWQPLAGKDVWVLPDNDATGRKYADTVAAILGALNPPATVKIIALPGLPEAGDVVDWVDAHGDSAEPRGMRAEIEALASAAEPAPAKLVTRGSGHRATFVPEMVCLADVAPEAVPWLWAGRIPLGRITLLVGRPGAGKSFLTCDIAARISTAAPWPGGGSAPLGDTLFICAEDDPADTIVPRLIGAAADRQRVHLLKAAKRLDGGGKETSVAFDLQNVELVRDALATLRGCKLVIVDPVGSYLGGHVDAHRDNEVRGLLAPLAALAAECSVAMLLVCHTRKAAAAFADDTALGSRAFVGLARSVLHLAADEGDRTRKLLLPGKCNLGESPPGLAFRIGGTPVRLEWEPEPLEGVHADDTMTPNGSPGAAGRPSAASRDAAAEWLRALLAHGPVAVKEIQAQLKQAGLTWRTVRRANEALNIVPLKSTFSGGWTWQLPGAEGGHGPRRGPSGEELGPLRENVAGSRDNPPENVEGGQDGQDVAAFDAAPYHVATFGTGRLFPDQNGLPD